MARKHVTIEDINEFRKYKSQGKTLEEVSKITGRSKSTVSRYWNGDFAHNSDEQYVTGGVKIYTPHYRRQIKYQPVRTINVYGNIVFEVDKEDKILKLVEYNSETDTYEPMKFPTKFAREDLDELINIGEALVGIAMTIKEEFEL